LNGIALLTQYQETLLALAPWCVDAATHPHWGGIQVLIQIGHIDEFTLTQRFSTLNHFEITIFASWEVNTTVFNIFIGFSRSIRCFIFGFLWMFKAKKTIKTFGWRIICECITLAALAASLASFFAAFFDWADSALASIVIVEAVI
jgi:hypothetical protein